MKTPIQAWINANIPEDDLLYRDAGIDQGVFFRDQLGRCIVRSYEEFTNCASVIGEHLSKSVKLPVVLFERPGLSVVVRDNFHDGPGWRGRPGLRRPAVLGHPQRLQLGGLRS